MATVAVLPVENAYPSVSPEQIDGGTDSGVSWAAILAGAVAAAALSLILLVLGSGLGLASVSPWSGNGATAKAITWSGIIWIVCTALVASGVGGYLAGRLRIKWAAMHTDEVFFRDTAHGFLAWGVATLLTAAALTSTIGAISGVAATGGAALAAAGGAQALGSQTMGPRSMAATAGNNGPALGMEGSGQVNQVPAYTMDSLFRMPAATPPATPAPTTAKGSAAGTAPAPLMTDAAGARDAKGEVARIFANGTAGQLSSEDSTYAGQLVAQRTGLSQQEAEARVNEIYSAGYKKLQDAETKAKQMADEARKNAAYASLWVFVSLLGGAFFASLMATVGGRRRDAF
ncbi:MAG: hypothetical protein ABI616_06345 [Pseudomonadota bacterium]